MRASAWAVLVVLSLGYAASARAGKRYESLMIDRVDSTAVLSGPLGVFTSASSWYEKTALPGGGMSVAEMRDGGCRGVYDFTAKGVLAHRARTLAVLEGSFGRVYANFDYWYPPAAPKIAVNTFARRTDFPHRTPEPSSPVRSPAESFALIRILRIPGSAKVAVASADYGPGGERRAFRVVITTGAAAEERAEPAEAGLPKAVKPSAFSRDPFAGVEAAVEPVVAEAALVYRARGTSVERIIRRGGRLERSWLSFPPAESERGLSKIEARYPLTPGP